MTVGATIMAHPSRLAWAEALAADLGCGITLDRVNDRHETGLRCLEAGLDSDATHHAIIQDDAIVCRDLLAGIGQAVQVSGDRLVGLYVGNVRPNTGQVKRKVAEARDRGGSWLAMPGPWWGVGIVIPTMHLPALIADYRHSRETNYDRRIERWATRAKVECWYTNPSLVEHRSGDENPSLVPGRTSTTRTARWFIGADQSALDIDWTKLPEVTHNRAVWRHRTGRELTVRPGSAQALRLELSGEWEPID